MNLTQLANDVKQNHAETQAELYKQADFIVNGNEHYFKAMSKEIDYHPIGHGARAHGCV